MRQDIESVRSANEHYHELMREGKSFDEILKECLTNTHSEGLYLNEILGRRGLTTEIRKTKKKEMMKTIKKVLILTGITGILFFLLFSFGFGTLDFLEWGYYGRSYFSVTVGTFFILFLMVMAINDDFDRSSK